MAFWIAYAMVGALVAVALLCANAHSSYAVRDAWSARNVLVACLWGLFWPVLGIVIPVVLLAIAYLEGRR